ncbi:MAG: NADH-quinone oxidoreductase subunit L [Acidobacteriota bacterium]
MEPSFLLPLIPGLPLLGFLVLVTFGRRLPKPAISAVACGSVFLAFLAAVRCVLALAALRPDARHIAASLGTWISVGQFSASLDLYLDPLSAAMILVVTGVGFLIHVYSTGYMHEEKDYARYFLALNLFTFAMLLLVLGKNLPLMFVGWEGVGLCSYLLIGFDYQKESAAYAGKKAFVVNRIGDAGFLLATFLCFETFQTVDMQEVRAILQGPHLTAAPGVLTAMALLLFLGATGKSAQIPLFVWLPDAMAGPTPVSALIHAATMVTAGVYMIARMSALYVLAPTAMLVVALVGGATALMAATIGLVQTDIKKVLAYSTVSQLGYMFLGLGAGAFGASIFHLVTHAFFKACLFLGAGSVIHALHGEQDIRKMGGLFSRIKGTALTFMLATAAIAGIPPLAGFFSKDAILAGVLHSPVLPQSVALALTATGYAAAFCTSFYMFRLFFLTFSGASRMDHEVEHHVHESPPSMLYVLWILAALSTVAGAMGLPGRLDRFGAWLEPSLASFEHGEHAESAMGEAVVMGLSFAVAVAGWLLARQSYFPTWAAAEARAARYKTLYTVFLRKYAWDEAYDAAIVGPLKRLARFLLEEIDLGGIDFLIDSLAVSVEIFGNLLKFFHTGYVRNYALSFVIGVVVLLFCLT